MLSCLLHPLLYMPLNNECIGHDNPPKYIVVSLCRPQNTNPLTASIDFHQLHPSTSSINIHQQHTPIDHIHWPPSSTASIDCIHQPSAYIDHMHRSTMNIHQVHLSPNHSMIFWHEGGVAKTFIMKIKQLYILCIEIVCSDQSPICHRSKIEVFLWDAIRVKFDPNHRSGDIK